VPGAQGDTGAQGPQGVAGAGFSNVYTQASTALGGTQNLSCDPGDIALSGGFYNANGAPTGSRPIPGTDGSTPTGWQWLLPEPGSEIYVVCADVTP
jgi:hypothetical protein